MAGRGIAEVQPETFPEVTLRGFGKVSGSFERGEAGSLLQIACEDESHAELVQAKYLSDLESLPGVKAVSLDVDGKKVSAVHALAQGYLGAGRKGNSVTIFASDSKKDFLRLLADKGDGLEFEAKIEVPMWLNRWDRHGFRFYYRPWETPPNHEQGKPYDIVQEFEFAEKNNRVGLALWAKPSAIDTGEGQNDEVWWDWAAKEAEKRKLPVGIHLGGGQESQVWLLNRYRDQAATKMPDFVGTFYSIAWPSLGATGWLSWCSTTAKDIQLGILQEMVKSHAQSPNVTSFLEPHGETKHGLHELFLEYGPVADSSYQRFLKEKYPQLSELNEAWGTSFTSWDEVTVPEVASFAGWDEYALDLKGDWRIGYEKLADGTQPSLKQLRDQGASVPPTQPAPEEWYAESFDDQEWPVITAPGHDMQMFLPIHPAVFRQKFEVPAEWKGKHQRLWLYVWDLTRRDGGEKVKIVLNGKPLAEEETDRVIPHWGAYEVTDALRSGTNTLAIRLPVSRLAYKVYLSPEEPAQYPDLGKNMNQRWADFNDWMAWSRAEAVGRGMQMIRQADKNRQITLMAPHSYSDQIKQLAKDYGGNFHDTGSMSAFWNDHLPSIMRGAGLPFSLEPGGPAKDVPELKKFLGLWSTEGLQGIDYFIHIGNVMWDPPMREFFEKNLNLFQLIGKYHAPPTEIAALYSERNTLLGEFPWKPNPATHLGSSYWTWNIRAVLRDYYESDGLTESSFADGDAAKYRVILDTNTSIMDERLVDEIDRFVKDGGVFVTFVQTGRHTSVQRDAWPIQRLTGYRVTEVEKPGWHPRGLELAPGQSVFTSDWTALLQGRGLSGLKLEKVADDAQNLLLWKDGTVAMGMRPLGKGYIIQMGCRFGEKGLPDRMDSGDMGAQNSVELKALRECLSQIFTWRGVSPMPATLEPHNVAIRVRHFISNNGLYDVWVLWNESPSQASEGVLALADARHAAWAIDVKSGERLELKKPQLNASLAPLETRAFLVQRGDVTEASEEWFALQRSWWRGTKSPSSEPLPEPPHKFSVDLRDDWAFRPVADGEDAAALCAVDIDDAGWERRSLGIWNLPDHRDVRRGVFRKRFTVPSDWTGGDIGLWLRSWFSTTFEDGGKIWLDGKPLTENLMADGVTNVNPDGVLTPGSQHVLAVEISGKGTLNGSKGGAWLWYWQKPLARQSLEGTWNITLPGDPLTPAGEVKLPGKFDGFVLSRKVVVNEDQKGRQVVIDINSIGPVGIVFINGHMVARHHHLIGSRWQLNVTPWIRFGQENVIQILSGGEAEITDVSLNYYQPDTYP